MHGNLVQMKGLVRKGEDLKQYVELLRGKSTTYKVLKKEVHNMATEYEVLVRTLQLLEQKETGNGTFRDSKASDIFTDANITSEDEVIQRSQHMLQELVNGTNIISAAPQSNKQSNLVEFGSISTVTSNGQEDSQIHLKKVWQQISELDMKLQEEQAKVAPFIKQLKNVRATLHDNEVAHANQQRNFIDMSLAYQR